MILLLVLVLILVAAWFNWCLEFFGERYWNKWYGFTVMLGAFALPIALILQIMWWCSI